MGNAIVHFELNGPDAEQTAKFYSELFGWHVQTVPQGGYHLIDTHGGGGMNGGIGQTREGQPSSVVFYVETPDIQATLDKAESLGAKTVVPLTEMEMVTFALFADPDGNAIGLVQSDPGQQGPGVSAGSNPRVDWVEVLGGDPKRAWDFYRNLFGWSIKESSGEGYQYGELDTGAGSGAAGGIGSSRDGNPRVNVYALVDDLAKYLERAEGLGGKTTMQPMKVGEGTAIAMLQDPQGTTLGLYTHQH